MSEARDTAGLLTTPGTKRSPSYTLTYTETDDHQFSTEEPSPKLYRAGVSTVRTPAELVQSVLELGAGMLSLGGHPRAQDDRRLDGHGGRGGVRSLGGRDHHAGPPGGDGRRGDGPPQLFPDCSRHPEGGRERSGRRRGGRILSVSDGA